MNNLNDDIILKILSIYHFKCNDCNDNSLFYGKYRNCFYCKKNLCLYHYNLAITRGKNKYIPLLQNNLHKYPICIECYKFYNYLEQLYNMK